MTLDAVVSQSNQGLLRAMLGRLAQMRTELAEINVELASHLPTVEAMGSEDLLASVVDQLISCATH